MAWTAEQVSQATGIPLLTLRGWRERSHLSFVARKFSDDAVAQVAAIAELTRHQIPIGEASRFLAQVAEREMWVKALAGSNRIWIFVTRYPADADYKSPSVLLHAGAAGNIAAIHAGLSEDGNAVAIYEVGSAIRTALRRLPQT
jgi:hypothetical protein